MTRLSGPSTLRRSSSEAPIGWPTKRSNPCRLSGASWALIAASSTRLKRHPSPMLGREWPRRGGEPVPRTGSGRALAAASSGSCTAPRRYPRRSSTVLIVPGSVGNQHSPTAVFAHRDKSIVGGRVAPGTTGCEASHPWVYTPSFNVLGRNQPDADSASPVLDKQYHYWLKCAFEEACRAWSFCALRWLCRPPDPACEPCLFGPGPVARWLCPSAQARLTLRPSCYKPSVPLSRRGLRAGAGAASRFSPRMQSERVCVIQTSSPAAVCR